MVLLSATQKLNSFLGPFILRNGLSLRYRLSGPVFKDNPTYDAFFMIPLMQKIITIEARHDQATKNSSSILSQLVHKSDETEKSPEKRLEILESYLRPVLAPSNQWKDVKRWQFHNRFIKWAREEVLFAKYGLHVSTVMQASPSLSNSLQLQLRNSAFSKLLSGKISLDSHEEEFSTPSLPRTAQLQDSFNLKKWANSKNSDAATAKMKSLAISLGGEMHEMAGGGWKFVTVPDETTDLSNLSVEEILELAGGHVLQCGPLNVLCDDADIYQFWTQEYIDGLGRYLKRRADSFSGETVILDVGAGDGLLTKHLSDYFKSLETAKSSPPKPKTRMAVATRSNSPKPNNSPQRTPAIIATDDGSWRVNEKAPVERITFADAISKYSDDDQQLIVLCSWMPMGQDWTQIFRSMQVDEYILIGESDDGACGDNWETWGNRAYLIDDDNSMNRPRLYEVDGYSRKELTSLLPHQWSRFDCSASKSGTTVRFRRVKKD